MSEEDYSFDDYSIESDYESDNNLDGDESVNSASEEESEDFGKTSDDSGDEGESDDDDDEENSDNYDENSDGSGDDEILVKVPEYLKKQENRLLNENERYRANRQNPKIVMGIDRKTRNIMSMYELVKLIGIRHTQLQDGAAPMLAGVENLTYPQQAYLELMQGVLPLMVHRPLANGTIIEIWDSSELRIPHEIREEYYVPKNFDMSQIRKLD